MLKWILGLCAAIYVTLILFGGDGYRPENVASIAPDTMPDTIPDTVEDAPQFPSDVAVETAPEPSVEIAAEPILTSLPQVDPAASQPRITAPTPDVVQARSTATTPQAREDDPRPATPEPEIIPVAVPGKIWRVTGTAVNLRSAATTNSDIIGRATAGESAEVIEMLPSGWARIYVLDTGLEAYISARFIAPE